MRCPKCGYISFDYVESCAKCSRDLSALAEALEGTAFMVEEPDFLSSVVGDLGEPAAVYDGGPEAEAFDLTGDEIDEAEDDVALEGNEEGVPSVDLSLFGQQGSEQEEPAVETEPELSLEEPDKEEEGGIEFAMEEPPEEPGPEEEEEGIEFHMEEEPDAEPELTLEEEAQEEEEAAIGPAPEEEVGEQAEISLEEAGADEEEAEETAEFADELPDLDMESAEEEEIDFAPEQMPEIELGELEEEPAESDAAEAGGGDFSLDIDVDLEEPAEEEMVFNLEDIDMSDLVIEESAESSDDTVEPTQNLEKYLAEGEEEGEGDDVPMDLSLEEGLLVEEDKEEKGAKEQTP